MGLWFKNRRFQIINFDQDWAGWIEPSLKNQSLWSIDFYQDWTGESQGLTETLSNETLDLNSEIPFSIEKEHF